MDTHTLLTDEQSADVVATVLDNNDGMAVATARRIVDEAIRYVATCAQFPTAPIAPSRVVDEGWHALILHTALYANLCERLGMFVHHYPERPDASRYNEDTLMRTVALMEEAGHTVDRELWTAPDRGLVPVAANCQHGGGPNCGPIQPMPKPGGTTTE